MKTVDFSETTEACDLKVGRYRQLIDLMKVQATLVTSTMHSSTLPLTSTQTPSPNIFPYMFIAFQQRIIRTTVSSSKRIIRHQFLVPIMNFRSFFDA